MSADQQTMIRESYLERNRTHEEIRRGGAIGNLNAGIGITTHSIPTRLIAWPGNGFQALSVHVLTHRPGDESPMYSYDMAEEALLCLKGKGEVFLRGRWVEIEAGDIAFFPAGVSRATRNPENNDRDFVLVNSISPPQFDLYEPFGYYDREHGVMRFEAIEKAKNTARLGSLSPENELHYNDSYQELRAWNLEAEDIRREGALFNVFMGAEFHGLDPALVAYLPGSHKAHMLLNLWPGYGVRSTGFHFAHGIPVLQSANVHTHPDSDECLILWSGRGQLYCGARWLEAETFDCVMAPCGVHHDIGGRRNPLAGRWFGGGFASPPQLDLYMKREYYKVGRFSRPPFVKLA